MADLVIHLSSACVVNSLCVAHSGRLLSAHVALDSDFPNDQPFAQVQQSLFETFSGSLSRMKEHQHSFESHLLLVEVQT